MVWYLVKGTVGVDLVEWFSAGVAVGGGVVWGLLHPAMVAGDGIGVEGDMGGCSGGFDTVVVFVSEGFTNVVV